MTGTPQEPKPLSKTAQSTILSLCTAALMAQDVLPPGVEDPIGLGPRLALIDHLKTVHDVTMPAGTNYAGLLAKYHALTAASKKVDREAALHRDRLQRMRDTLGLDQNTVLDEQALQERYQKHQQKERSRYGSGHSTAGVDRSTGKSPEAKATPDSIGPIDDNNDNKDETVVKEAKQDSSDEHIPDGSKLLPAGAIRRVRELDAYDRDSDGGRLKFQYNTAKYIVRTNTSRELTVQIASYLNTYRDAIIPEMQLDRPARMKNPTVVSIYASQRDYLDSKLDPSQGTHSQTFLTHDQNDKAVDIQIGAYGSKLHHILKRMRAQVIQAIHLEAFGNVEFNWYTAGFALYFANWNINKSTTENRKHRTKLLSQLEYVRYQTSIDKLPDIHSFITTWDENNQYSYEMAEAVVDYLLREDEAMLKKCHGKARAKAPDKYWFTEREIQRINKGLQRFLKREMKKGS